MKKSLFLAALATIALASCTQNEDFSQPEKISFNPVNYKAQSTKAPINGAYYESDYPSFGIFAFHTDKGWDVVGTQETPNPINVYIPNSEVSWNYTKNEWNTATDAYWPLSGSLTFIGYTPYGVTAEYAKETKTLTIAGFSAANQDDLMYTLPSDAQDLTVNSAPYIQEQGGTSAYSGVPIKFRHALSQIVVTAKVADTYTGAVYNITGLSLQSMDDNNTLNVTENATPVASWGTASVETATFSIFSGTSANLDTRGANVGSAVLVIPQALDANQQKLVVNYQMTYNGVTTSTSRDVYLNSGASPLTALDMGKKYTLNLTLYADRILYSPSVAEDWSDGDSDYDVPEQPTQNP